MMKGCSEMKQHMMVAALLLYVGVAVAAPPAKSAKWQDDFALAQAQAKKEGRPILADFTGSDWCCLLYTSPSPRDS